MTQRGRVRVALVLTGSLALLAIAAAAIVPGAKLQAWLATSTLLGHGGSRPLLSPVFAMAGWAVSVLLIAYLFYITRRWRATFRGREIVVLPDHFVSDLDGRVRQLVTQSEAVGRAVNASLGSIDGASQHFALSVDQLREEFGILRTSLEERTKEVQMLRAGYEHSYRRSVLRRVVSVMDIIDEDQRHSRDPNTTLRGVLAELTECLEDAGVQVVPPIVGWPISEVVGCDMQAVAYLDTTDPEQVGRVAKVERPTYVYRSPSGQFDVLLPPKIVVYRLASQ